MRMLWRWLWAPALLGVCFAQETDSSTNATAPALPAEPEPTKNEAMMIVIKTSMGDIQVELDEARAPKTVANFLKYVDEGHYAGTIFHRVIDGFMIQGGGFTPDFRQKKTRAPVLNEADNGLKNKRGTIAMARTSEVHSGTCQFFINVADNDFLDHTAPTPQGFGYCVFGRVVAGMDVVDRIKGVKTGGQGPFPKDVPIETVTILSMTRL